MTFLRDARRTLLLAIVVAIAAAADGHAAAPNSMAAIGDSYTAGLFTGAPCAPMAICPANSWSTGTNAAVNSHYQRILATNPLISGRNFLAAASAKKVADLGRQAQLAIGQHAEYVTIMLGLNDACRENEGAMTPVGTFRSQFATGMSALVDGLPQARIFVASIPDIERLRAILAANATARARWAQLAVCQVVLADPQSTAPAVVARRQRARQRVIDFNGQLAEVCAQHATCRYDGGAVFGWAFAPADFVAHDYFHLSVHGEASLAAVTAAASYDFVSGVPDPPPPPTPAPVPPPPAPTPPPAPAPALGRCDAERAPVKMLTDAAASRVHLTAKPKTVGALRRLARPDVTRNAQRLRGEFSAYRVKVRLRSIRLERSLALRLVVADPANAARTMFVRFAAPGCAAAKRAPGARRTARARAALLAWCGRPKAGTARALSATATITGVAFFDAARTARDVAPNGIALAPVLSIAKTSRCRRR